MLKIQIEQLIVNATVPGAGGDWTYVGANAMEVSTQEKVQLLAVKREISASGISFPASMLTATILFTSRDNDVADNLTIQGIHDLTSNNETGSVSSASRKYSAYVGGPFSFDAGKGLLTIFAPGE